jgi:tetrapyrrole methylase family protein/MazG family protein
VSDEPQPYPAGLPALFEVVRRLRAPDGCPWDREQTHESLRPYLLEETYEVLDAIDSGDDSKLVEELGDLLLQVAMHAEIAAQDGRWDAATVSEREAAKMVARHPHVFGDTSVADAAEVLRNWERQKAAEAHAQGRTEESVLDRVTPSLPALAWTLSLQKRAARVGFDFGSPRAAAQAVAEEAAELAAAARPGEVFDELGDLLFALVSLARKLKVNPEDALRASGRRFADRFRVLEGRARAAGVDLHDVPDDEIGRMWQATGESV